MKPIPVTTMPGGYLLVHVTDWAALIRHVRNRK